MLFILISKMTLFELISQAVKAALDIWRFAGDNIFSLRLT